MTDFTEAQKRTIVTGYAAGKTVYVFAQMFNCTPGVILRLLRSQNVKIRPTGSGGTQIIDGKKKCGRCKKQKVVDDFAFNKTAKSKLTSYCKECINKEATVSKRRTRHGVTPEEYAIASAKQKNLCAICGKPETRLNRGTVTSLSIDVNPTTGKLRGLLCYKCKDGIVKFSNDSKLLTKAIKYVGLV